MMHHSRLLPVLLFLFITLLANAQSPSVNSFPAQAGKLLCLYKLNYQPDSTTGFRSSELMRLELGNSVSRFESKGTYLLDSLSAAMPDTPGSGYDPQTYADKLMSLPHTRLRFRIYKNLSSNKLYYYEEISSVLYKYEEAAPIYKWSVLPDKATIAGYACQKATTTYAGRTYEAWFTREVAVADGPYKFYGLPGLIVKVSDSRGQYVFELVKLTRFKAPVTISLPNRKAVPTTKLALRQAQENYKANLPNIVAAATTQKSEAAKQDVRTRVKRMNNALEIR